MPGHSSSSRKTTILNYALLKKSKPNWSKTTKLGKQTGLPTNYTFPNPNELNSRIMNSITDFNPSCIKTHYASANSWNRIAFWGACPTRSARQPWRASRTSGASPPSVDALEASPNPDLEATVVTVRLLPQSVYYLHLLVQQSYSVGERILPKIGDGFRGAILKRRLLSPKR
jgi:hypothetical protein